MKNDDAEPILLAIRQLLDGPLAQAAAVRLAEPALTGGEMLHGFHCHDAWELFCPLQADLQFVVAGQPAVTIPTRHLLIVPPGCLHMSVDRLPQPPELALLVMNLPGNENPYGGLSVGTPGERCSRALSPTELAAWTTSAGATPGLLMEQVVRALARDGWGREQALGLLRVLIAAFAEVVTGTPELRPSLSVSRVAEAQIFLQSHYYEPTLTIDTVAAALGLSASHLAAIFRKETGRSLHQTLVDLRLRRATDLLEHSSYSIKEVAALTGWSNQLYFSAAYRRHYGKPPSAERVAKWPTQRT